jgi:glycosyltransferase involved in cell wall biosynthesis
VSRILVVLPSLNEGATIQEIVLEVTTACYSLPNAEISFLIADDSQGTDSPLNDLARQDSRVRLFIPTSRLGHQRGLTAALRHVKEELPAFDAVVTMDADGEDRPVDVPRLIAPILDNQCDLVRAQRGKRNVHHSFTLGYLIYRAIFRTLTGMTITSGNFAAARGTWWHDELNSKIWNLTFSGTLASVTGRVADIPCDRDPRRQGKSRMNFSSLIGYGLMFALPFSLRIAVRAAVLTAIAAVVSVIAVITVVALRIFTDTSTPGWTTTVAFGAAAVVLIAFVALTSALVLYASTMSGRADSGKIARP